MLGTKPQQSEFNPGKTHNGGERKLSVFTTLVSGRHMHAVTHAPYTYTTHTH